MTLKSIRATITRRIKDVDAWDGSASRWADTEAYCRDCLINTNTEAGNTDPADWTQTNCKLPIREPGDGSDTFVRQAVFAAAGGNGISQVTKPAGVSDDDWNAAVSAAARQLVTAYEEMDQEPPESVTALTRTKEQRMKTRGTTLASRLNGLVDDMVTDEMSRADVIAAMGSAAGIEAGTVNQILNNEIDCPPIARLEGFAEALGVSASSIMSAAEDDGCDYGEERGLWQRMWRAFRRAFAAEVEEPDGCRNCGNERAMSFDRIYERVGNHLYSYDDFMWLHGIYRADDGMIYCIVSREGELLRANLTISGDEVMVGQFMRVTEEFPVIGEAMMGEGMAPEAMRSTTTIRRQADGRWRWFSISATSVLNRVGEIDSRELFDSFAAHAEKTGEYPIRMFYHAGAAYRTGQADFLARDGNAYITSGVYDDTELARREVKARQKEPGYWGDSIGYVPTVEPEMVRIAEGVTVPVFWAGINYEISTLPEAEAANLMTNSTEIQEVQRMLSGKSFEALVRLFDGDEDAARRWMEENPDNLNRAIEEAGLVTRSQDDGDPAGEEPTTDPTDRTVELDEEAVEQLAEAVTRNVAFVEMAQQVSGLQEQVGVLRAALETSQAEAEALAQRVKALEADEADKQRQWLEDRPRQETLRVTYRPRVNRAPEARGEEADETTAADKVAERLGTIPKAY